MKNIFFLLRQLLGLSALSLLTITATAQTDPVKKANETNEAKADKGVVDEDVAEFLVKSADARMMDIKEGKMAISKASSKDLQDYGRLMVKDQTMLLDEIKKLASKVNVTLPMGISEEKQEGQEDLSEESGIDFDEKFIKMMKIDHERDIKLFKKAIDCTEPSVSAFAKKYLPLIESHLAKIEAIKKKS